MYSYYSLSTFFLPQNSPLSYPFAVGTLKNGLCRVPHKPRAEGWVSSLPTGGLLLWATAETIPFMIATPSPYLKKAGFELTGMVSCHLLFPLHINSLLFGPQPFVRVGSHCRPVRSPVDTYPTWASEPPTEFSGYPHWMFYGEESSLLTVALTDDSCLPAVQYFLPQGTMHSHFFPLPVSTSFTRN